MMDSATLDHDLSSATDASQYLTFVLAEEQYAVEILKVQEIKGLSIVTRLPNSPAHVKGVTNLRGAVVPIVDLRSRFGLPVRAHNLCSVFVIVKVGEKVVGLVVDSVEDVIDLAPEAIQPPSELTQSLGGACVRGIARRNEQLIALLDIDKIVSADLAALDAACVS